MKRLVIPFMLLAAGTAFAAPTTQPGIDDVEHAFHTDLAPHPRLLLHKDQIDALKAKIAADPQLKAIESILHADVDRAMPMPPVHRVMNGRRMLGTSREFINRVVGMGLEYFLTGDKKYAARAREEMLAMAQFTDWDPNHFLDVGEATAGMAIGYDWLYDTLSPDDRAAIRDAIATKGLDASYSQDFGWINGTNNWASVCHGGLTLGALAIAEDQPQLAAKIISRAIPRVRRAIAEYGPNGAYPEGPGYWEYGTTYNVLMIASLDSALGTDYGLKDVPGFMHTAEFMLHSTGPTGQWFNFADCARRGPFSPAAPMWWFSSQRHDESLLFNERRLLGDDPTRLPFNRHSDSRSGLPFLLIWAGDKGSPVVEPKATQYVASGTTPVAFFRSSWKNDATFFGIKGGFPQYSHGHEDIGSFVLDMKGVRWADDLGLQDYGSLESKVDLWNMAEGSTRWDVFRISAASHNVITVDGKGQLVAQRGDIADSGKNFVVIDSSPVYKNQLASIRRGMRLNDDGSVRVQDEIHGNDASHSVRWAMLTRADVKIVGDSEAVLSRDGQEITMKIIGDSGERSPFRIYSTDPPHPYDAPNPGTRMVGFEFKLNSGETRTLVIDFTPQEQTTAPVAPLSNWK